MIQYEARLQGIRRELYSAQAEVERLECTVASQQIKLEQHERAADATSAEHKATLDELDTVSQRSRRACCGQVTRVQNDAAMKIAAMQKQLQKAKVWLYDCDCNCE